MSGNIVCTPGHLLRKEEISVYRDKGAPGSFKFEKGRKFDFTVEMWNAVSSLLCK
jgi:hypothetical protein